MKILLSSYSFGAGRGSEAGVGWNVAAGLAQRGHEVTVLTTTEFTESNRKAIEAQHLRLRLWEWDEGLADFPNRATYNRWQKRVRPRLKKALKEESFDVFHHVTFNQYRGIRDVFGTELPYLIGPIGGAELIPGSHLFDAAIPCATTLKESMRHFPFDALPLILRCNRTRARGMVLASNLPTALRLNRNLLAGLNTPATVCPSIAIHRSEIVEEPSPRAEKPYFIFDGGLRPEKGAHLLLRSLARAWEAGCRIPVRMAAVKDPERLRRMAASEGLPPEAIEPMAFMARGEMLAMMRGAVAFISASLRDSGCMALLESIAQGVPSICWDIPSQEWLPGEFATKIPLFPRQKIAFSTAEFSLRGLQAALLQAAGSPPRPAEWHRRRCDWLRANMTWEVRLSQLETCYRQLTT